MPKGLVVIDGTWHHARAMYRDIAALRDLPKFTLPRGEVSGFKIRRQPFEYCLSTIEAIHAALRYTEPNTPGLANLLAPFEAMQALQLARPNAPSPRLRRRPRSERGPELPAAFRERFDALVVVYGELTPRTCEEMKQPMGDRPLLTLAAERPASGERMMVALDHDQLTQGSWPFFRLDRGDHASASCPAEMAETWRAFERPGDVLATWNTGTSKQWYETFGGPRAPLVLKAHYCNHRTGRGTLDEIVASEALLTESALDKNRGERSRTEERLANAVAVARAAPCPGPDPTGCRRPQAVPRGGVRRETRASPLSVAASPSASGATLSRSVCHGRSSPPPHGTTGGSRGERQARSTRARRNRPRAGVRRVSTSAPAPALAARRLMARAAHASVRHGRRARPARAAPVPRGAPSRGPPDLPISSRAGTVLGSTADRPDEASPSHLTGGAQGDQTVGRRHRGRGETSRRERRLDSGRNDA